jgi:Na+/phosphate symporter
MSDVQISRWAGAFGVAGFVVFLLALPLYFGGTAAPVQDTARFSDYVTSINTSILVRTSLADPLIFVGLLVFLGGFRHLIRQAGQEYEWLATLVFGVGVLLVTLELVGDGLEAGAALDTVAKGEPTVVRGLMEASFPLYGAIGLIMTALLLGSAAYATLATRVLPRWTGWFAAAGAAINLAVAPSILGGTDFTAFWSANGWATFVAQAAMVLWFLVASISMIRRRKAEATTAVHRPEPAA